MNASPESLSSEQIWLAVGFLLVVLLVMTTLVVGGAWLARGWLDHRKDPAPVLMRGPYFAAQQVLAVPFSLCLWLAGLMAATDSNLLLFLSLLTLALTFVGFGFCAMVLGEARALDSYGKRGLGYKALIPGLNIWLCLRAPLSPAPEGQKVLLPGLVGWRGVAVGLAIAVTMRAIL